MKCFSLSRLQLEKALTEKEAQVKVQASEITASEERMRRLQTQLQQTQVGFATELGVLTAPVVLLCFSLRRWSWKESAEQRMSSWQ